jgi:hypothetical protein
MLVLGVLAPHWVMAGEPCNGLPAPLAHVEAGHANSHSSAALHHHLDHEHSHDVGALITLRRELSQLAPAVPLYRGQVLLRLPVAFGIDRPPRA